MNTITESRWYPLFNWLVNHPWLMLTLGVLFIAISASGLTRLVKDTSVDAFVPEGHSSLLANERTTELFGLSEPIAIAVFVEPGRSVFDAPTMAVIAELTERVAEVDNINSERVASIATESYIRGEDGAILVEDYLEQTDYATPAEIQGHWNNMPPHINTLVSEDARGAVIMAEVIDSHASAATYLNVQALVEEFAEPGLEIYIAGPAAVSGYLSEYIDGDARIMQPIVFLVVIVFLYLAFMKSSALLGPIVVLLGSAGGSLGIMAWQGIPYYAITNALPVILVSISVADAIHILSAYFEDRAENPQRAQREAVICAMLNMARPITLTTITTIAGFFGIAAVSIMPPIYYFAVYAMLGIFLAWCFSLFILPAVLVLIKPSQSRFFVNWKMDTPDRIGMALGRISLAGLARPGQVLLGAAIIVAIAWMGASSLTIDRSQVDNFSKDEPIHIADDLINERFAGTAFLDVILHSEEPDGMLLPHNMQKVAALQSFLEGQEHVAKTVSIADYITLLDSAINAKVPDAQRTIPTQEGAVAQYLMVYEASGDPTDFEEEITPDYQTVLVRTVLDSHYFSDSKKVVTALQAYLDQEFSSPDLQATIAGDVNVSYHWMTALQTTHFLGIGISLLLIFVTSAIVFRSLPVGVIAVIPVTFTVLCLYGLMGYLGINLEPATSMFAAISVGVGVDFA
ncbi:MAG: MMPL family transporter, partial [Pseudomonadota bacterium]